MKLWLLIVVVSAFDVGIAEGQAKPQDVIIFAQDSDNIRRGLPSIQESLGNFFRAYGGHARTLQFNIYRHALRGQIERMTVSREADDIVGAFSAMASSPMPANTCPDVCCCSSNVFSLLRDTMKENHPKGGLLFLLHDCFEDPNQDDFNELKEILRRTNSFVFSVKMRNSYCQGMPTKANAWWTDLGSFQYTLDSDNIGQALYTQLISQFNSTFETQLFCVPCSNRTVRAFVRYETQALLFIMAHGQNNFPVTLLDKHDQPWTKNKVELLSADGKPWALAWYGGCASGWTFHNGDCYFRGPQRATYEKADAFCRAKNSTLLVDISTKDRESLFENDALWTPVSNDNGDLDLDSESSWMSLTDSNIRRSFTWNLFGPQFIELDHLKYTAWGKGEPSLLIPPGARCTQLTRRTGLWTTAYCRSLRPFTCIRSAYVFSDEAPRVLLPNQQYKANIDVFGGCDYYFYLLF